MSTLRNHRHTRKTAKAAGVAALALLALVSLASAPALPISSQPSPPPANPFLLSAYFKALQLKSAADQAVAKLESEIRKNRDSADRARSLMALAAQRSDESARRAEQTAAQALRLAEESLARNEQTLAEWRLRKARAEKSMAAVKDMLSAGPAGASGVLGAVTDLKGRAEIVRKSGSPLSLEGDAPGFLEPGDRIKTKDGSAELQLLGGRASTRLDRDSELEALNDKPGEQSFELIKGRLHGVVDKAEEYMARLKQGLQDYREDLAAIGDLIKDEELQRTLAKRLELFLYNRYRPKTPVVVIGIRGTEFVFERFSDGGGELWVLDGEVEINIAGKEEPILVRTGQKCTISDQGAATPIPFDNLDRWWEK